MSTPKTFNKSLVTIVVASCLTCISCLAEGWNGKKNGQRNYPLGVLGGTAIVHIGKPDFEVESLTQGEAGQNGGLQIGDRIISANGKNFEEYDNSIGTGGKGGPKGLGEALDDALENGNLRLTVVRGDKKVNLNITVPTWGSLGAEWPMDDTTRVQAFRDGVCEYLHSMLLGKKGRVSVYGGTSSDITKAMAGLALIASGNPSYSDSVKELAHAFSAQTVENYGSNWKTYYLGVFMSEYFLTTRDEEVLPWIQSAVNHIQGRMNEKGYIGHGGAYPNAMYGHAAGFNPVGSGSLWFMALAEKCGVNVDIELWDSTAEWLGKSSGGGGSIGYSMWARGGADAHSRSAQTMLGLSVAQKEKALRNSIGEWLANNPGSIRESHAYSASGVMTTFLALYMHDSKEYRRQLDIWKWYFTLAEGPDHVASYIGGKRNNGGDTYLGKQGIFNAMMGVILSAPKQTLYMYGALPSIPGISPGSLSSELYYIVSTYRKTYPKITLEKLRHIITKQPTGKNSRDAVLIGRHIYNEQVKPYWQEVLELNATGDLYKTKDLFKQFILDCGRPTPIKDEISFMEFILESQRGRRIVKRGEKYYKIVNDWDEYPNSRSKHRHNFEILAQDDSDLYGHKSIKTLAALERYEQEKATFDTLTEEEIEATRQEALEL